MAETITAEERKERIRKYESNQDKIAELNERTKGELVVLVQAVIKENICQYLDVEMATGTPFREYSLVCTRKKSQFNGFFNEPITIETCALCSCYVKARNPFNYSFFPQNFLGAIFLKPEEIRA